MVVRETYSIQNAVIEDTFFGIEDHGFLTFSLGLDFGAFHQGWGLFVLGKPDGDVDNGGFTPRIFMSILAVTGTSQWEQLKGKHIRVARSREQIFAVGHILRDEWIRVQNGTVLRGPLEVVMGDE